MKKRVMITILVVILIIILLAVLIMLALVFSNINPNPRPLNPDSNSQSTTNNPPITINNQSSTQKIPQPNAWSKTSNYTLSDCYDICSYVYQNDQPSMTDDCQGKCGLFNQQSDLDRFVNFIRVLKK